MTTATLFMPNHNALLQHADGGINFDAYRQIAMAERRKALRQVWSWIAVAIRPQTSRPLMSRYAARLG